MFTISPNKEKEDYQMVNSDFASTPDFSQYLFVGSDNTIVKTFQNIATNQDIQPSAFDYVATVWATGINSLEQFAMKRFTVTGAYDGSTMGFYSSDITLSNIWNQHTTTWITQAVTKRIMSRWVLTAWQTVGANIFIKNAMYINQNNSWIWVNIITSYTFKLIRTDWTLVTIWTVSPDTITISASSTDKWYVFVKEWTLTPQVAQEWDRIIIEVKVSVAITTNSATSNYLYLYFLMGAAGSYFQWVPLSYTWREFSPIQISVT